MAAAHDEVDDGEDQNDPEAAKNGICKVGSNQRGQVYRGLPHLQLSKQQPPQWQQAAATHLAAGSSKPFAFSAHNPACHG